VVTGWLTVGGDTDKVSASGDILVAGISTVRVINAVSRAISAAGSTTAAWATIRADTRDRSGLALAGRARATTVSARSTAGARLASVTVEATPASVTAGGTRASGTTGGILVSEVEAGIPGEGPLASTTASVSAR